MPKTLPVPKKSNKYETTVNCKVNIGYSTEINNLTYFIMVCIWKQLFGEWEQTLFLEKKVFQNKYFTFFN